jgi:hypothetical protein
MLRTLALTLLLANGLFYAWDQGLLRGLGLGPAQQSEPQRLAQQIKPDALKLLKPEEFKRIEDQIREEQAPTECLQAGPLDAAQGEALRQELGPLLPEGTWQLLETPVTARWIVYMGKYNTPDALAKKRAEVVAMNLKAESLVNPALEPGFSVGVFEARLEAESALQRLTARGLRSARVVQEREAAMAYQLKLPRVSAALKPKLASLGATLGAKPLHACN